jgi:hypothetical protein
MEILATVFHGPSFDKRRETLMPTAELIKKTITIKFRNDLKAGKKGKYGSIKTDEGESYLAQQDIWEKLEPGSTCHIDYERSTGDFPPWIRMVSAENGDALTPPVRTILVDRSGREVTTASAYKRPETSDKDSEHMFVSGLMNAWARAGALNIDEENGKHAGRIAMRIYLAIWPHDMKGDSNPY